MSPREPSEYVVPCYVAAEGEPWLHFLHGNVPGHEIDFMYRPEVPQGALTRQHFSHLSRLLKYIEPHRGAEHAFAIGNLSRDDTQHEPGHGGLALIFGLRIRGTVDHAGRPDPPFAHGIATIDRSLDAGTLFAAATAFHRHVLGEAASAEWYRSYVAAGGEPPEHIARILAGYVASFADLPRPDPSDLSLTWTTGGATQTGRIVFVHPDDAPFADLARAASRLAAVLYRSDVRWSAISTGREADLPNGVTVRLLPESAIGPGDPAAALHGLSDIPEEDEAIARKLFGARPVEPVPRVSFSWRDRIGTTSCEIEIDSTPMHTASDPEIRVSSVDPAAEVPRSSTRPRAAAVDEGDLEMALPMAETAPEPALSGAEGAPLTEEEEPPTPREGAAAARISAVNGITEVASEAAAVVRSEAEAAAAVPEAPAAAGVDAPVAAAVSAAASGDSVPAAAEPAPAAAAAVAEPAPAPAATTPVVRDRPAPSERPRKPVPSERPRTHATPAPLAAIPVPLELVSPPPRVEVRETPKAPPPRGKRALFATASCVAALGAMLYALFVWTAGSGNAPVPTAPAESAATVVEAPPAALRAAPVAETVPQEKAVEREAPAATSTPVAEPLPAVGQEKATRPVKKPTGAIGGGGKRPCSVFGGPSCIGR